MQKRYKWNKEKLNCLKKEKETAFQCNVTTTWHFCPSGCKPVLLMKEAPLALCERLILLKSVVAFPLNSM